MIDTTLIKKYYSKIGDRSYYIFCKKRRYQEENAHNGQQRYHWLQAWSIMVCVFDCRCTKNLNSGIQLIMLFSRFVWFKNIIYLSASWKQKYFPQICNCEVTFIELHYWFKVIFVNWAKLTFACKSKTFKSSYSYALLILTKSP